MIRTRWVVACATAIALAGCSDDDATTTASESSTSVAPGVTVTAPTAEVTTSGAATGAPAPSVAPGTQGTTGSTVTSPATTASPAVFGNPVVTLHEVAEVEQPVGMAVRPGDTSLYVVGQDGIVYRITVDAGASQVGEVADLTDKTSSSGEQGLLGIAFSSDGAVAWLDYTDNDGNTVVAEYPVSADGAFDVEAERVLLHIDQPYANHNGGDLQLGPDGMLYVAMGDGGSGGDPERRASDPTTLLGKLLRIDPTPSGDAPYTIPPDNPFATGSMGDLPGAPEVWAWGLRNPWRIAFDPATAELWIADVGQNEIEEVDAVGPTAEHPAGWGANFGWSAYEGNNRFNEDVPDPGDLVFPVWTYSHAEGCSIAGGEVYRGAAIAELAPAYVFSDLCSGKLWAFDVASGRNETLVDGLSEVVAVRTGPDGELYVLQHGGAVSKLVQG